MFQGDGTGIQQALQIVSAQGVGFVSGEWRDVRGPCRRFMVVAVAFLLGAVLMMGFSQVLS